MAQGIASNRGSSGEVPKASQTVFYVHRHGRELADTRLWVISPPNMRVKSPIWHAKTSGSTSLLVPEVPIPKRFLHSQDQNPWAELYLVSPQMSN